MRPILLIELLQSIDELTEIIDELKDFEQRLIAIPIPESRTTQFILSEALDKVEKYVLQYEDQLIELQDQYVMVLREEEE
tara:strand:- start:2072 stop:2311 length:240 start_codon:yes stop_codon:yes gene_type:complete